LLLCAGVIAAVLVSGCDEVITTIARLDADGGGGTLGAGGDLLGAGGLGSGGESSGGAALFGGEGGMGGSPIFGTTFEAEDGTLSGPFSVGLSPEAEGGAFLTADMPADLADSPGEALATYLFSLDASGDYVLWGRIHSPAVSANRFWFRVDDGPWTLWRVSTGEEWFWDDVHDNLNYGEAIVFSLEAGEHRLQIGNAVTGAELDRFFWGALGQPGPTQDTICNPPHSVLMGGSCVSSCGSYGKVSCGTDVCAGKPEVVSYDCTLCCLLD
jgi:hypothetical protein